MAASRLSAAAPRGTATTRPPSSSSDAPPARSASSRARPESAAATAATTAAAIAPATAPACSQGVRARRRSCAQDRRASRLTAARRRPCPGGARAPARGPRAARRRRARRRRARARGRSRAGRRRQHPGVVEHHQRGVAGHGQREAEAPPALGVEAPRAPAGDELQAGALQRVAGGRARRGRAPQRGDHRDGLVDAQPRGEAAPLGPVADPVRHAHPPGARHQAQQPPQQARLAGAGRPPHQEPLPGAEAQRDAAHGRVGTPVVPDLQAVGRDERRLRAGHPERMTSSTSSRRRSMSASLTSDSRLSRISGSVLEGRTLKCQSSCSTDRPSISTWRASA